MRILSLQPYFGGSHQSFQLEWQRHSQHDWTVLSLPPRHWKWRMRHAAVHFAGQLRDEYASANFDAVFCSDFLNVAEFKGLAAPPVSRLPLLLYFHENQFAYPVRHSYPRDLHFGFTNFTSCLAADQVWFNSRFNQQSFLDGLGEACLHWPDHLPTEAIASLPNKFQVQTPGIRVPSPVPLEPKRLTSTPIRLLWAARWEHDKNPGMLLAALRELQRRQIDFRISVIGQSFRRVPQEIEQIHNEFSDRLDRWGFQESQQAYRQAMRNADVFLSTADHEFFGIAAAEAIALGLFPLLPDRLAYPELLSAERLPERRDWFLYDGTPTGLVDQLQCLCHPKDRPRVELARQQLQGDLAVQLSWDYRAFVMDREFARLCGLGRTPP